MTLSKYQVSFRLSSEWRGNERKMRARGTGNFQKRGKKTHNLSFKFVPKSARFLMCGVHWKACLGVLIGDLCH